MLAGRSISRKFRWQRAFSTTASRAEVRDAAELPDRISPKYLSSPPSDLLSLQWPSPPRNFLIIKKNRSPHITDSTLEYAKHIASNYSSASLIFEPAVASALHSLLPFPIYSTHRPDVLARKVDMTSTLGGDGTILHASSLFATTGSVPPILSFSMGSLGFLGEWKFAEYKRAFREVYMSGAGAGSHLVRGDEHPHNHTPRATSSASSSSASTSLGDAGVAGWSSIRGKSMGPARSSKVLLRNRLKVGVFDASGNRINATDSHSPEPDNGNGDIHAMNEVLIHRGANPHLAIITILLNDRPLTEAVADGILISTPTGSTAYSLSSGGSIVHPLVSSLLVTPICPRSLSFRPLVLPANTRVTLRLSERNRGRDLEVSVDGKRRSLGVGVGMEVRVVGEECTPSGTTSLTGGMEVDANGRCGGGVPCIMRANAAGKLEEEDDGWVGGLNGLLKFNYPFGEES